MEPKYILYKSVKYIVIDDTKINKYWKLTLNMYNLIKESNYGVANDFQTVLLYTLCNDLNNVFRDFICTDTINTQDIGNEIKRIIFRYNSFVSSKRVLCKHVPRIKNYRLILNNCNFNWDKRVKIFVV